MPGTAKVLEPRAGTIARLRRLLASYPGLLGQADDPCWDMLASGQLVRAPAGSVLFDESSRCREFMLIARGQVRVYRHSRDGREVTLYRVKPGGLCFHSLNALLHGEPYPAVAQAEEEVEALRISHAAFHRALARSAGFRDYVLQTMTRRMAELIDLVSGVVFDRLELRLACWLGQQFERAAGQPLRMTHQRIAQELGSTREVISRLLKEFERQGCIRLGRGSIHLVSTEGLGWVARRRVG